MITSVLDNTVILYRNRLKFLNEPPYARSHMANNLDNPAEAG